jgi:pimeloyl-ACP methyl ester carboxylesterase
MTGYADVNGARFYYQIYGDLNSQRSPLLVLHGAYMPSDAMAPLIRPFMVSRPVIALDARGHGRTGDVPGGITYEQLANADLIAHVAIPFLDDIKPITPPGFLPNSDVN